MFVCAPRGCLTLYYVYYFGALPPLPWVLQQQQNSNSILDFAARRLNNRLNGLKQKFGKSVFVLLNVKNASISTSCLRI